MAAKRKSSKSDSRPVQGFFKWIIKCLLTQVGCLSKQEFEEQYPPDGASSFDNLIGHVDNSDVKTNQGHRKDKNRPKKQDEVFDEDVSSHQCCDSSDKKTREKAGGAIMSFQNCTLQCADPGNGESYWVSFEEKSFSKGDDFKVYSGRINGIGPKCGDKCVVKVFRRCKGTENLCRCEVKKCQTSKAMAKAFNAFMHKKIVIKFTTLYWAQMDEVSKIKQLFFTGERKLSTKETVLFEDDLRVNDERPSKHKELTLFMDCQGKKRRCVAKDLEAFAHFTYHHSNGQLVLCGLDGVQDEDGFFLKTPIIHSRTQEYGNSDCGLQGILEVFGNHVCNDFCKDMMKPNEDLNNLAAKNKNDVMFGKCSTTLPSAFQGQEAKIPHVVSRTYRPPLERQDSVVSKGSFFSDPHMTDRQDSSLSQVTESLSGYLEPSAPIEEYSEVVFEPTPPPYSSVNVANWLLHEHAQNSFINSAPFDPLPPVRTDSLVNRMSIESGLGASVMTPSDRSSLQGTSMDLNANFPEEDIDNSAVSTSGYCDDYDENDRTISVQCDKKRVRFSLSGDAVSSNSSSEVATTAATSSGPTEMSTVACGTSNASTQFHSFLMRNSARLFSHSDCSDLYHSLHHINRGCAIPKYGTLDELAIHRGANRGSNSNQPSLESPPSYIDSEMTAAWWIMKRECMAGKVAVSNIRHTDNGHLSTAIANNVHNTVVPSVHTTTSVLKKSKPQQVPMSRSS